MQDPKKKKLRELIRESKERERHPIHKIGKHFMNEVVRWVSCCEKSSNIRTIKISFRCDRYSLVNTNYSDKYRSEWQRVCQWKDKREIARAICSIKKKRECLQEGDKVNFSHVGETSPCLLADNKLRGRTDRRLVRFKI